MKRRTLVGAGASAAAAGAGVALWRLQSAADPLAEFWTLRLPQPAGGELALASLRGRPLLVNFWATWCPPCIRELPLLDSFWREHRGSGWQVLGWAIDEPGPVQQFLQRAPVGFPIVLATSLGLDWSRRLGNSGGGLPYTTWLDRRGMQREFKAGEVTAAELAAWRVAADG